MIVKLPYGPDSVALDLRGVRVRPLVPSAPAGGRGVPSLVGDAIDHPLAGPPLLELARDRKSATIIVPDATRKVPLPEIVPVLLERLRRAGVREDRTTILIACGTHPAVGISNTRRLLGDVPESVSVIEHDSRDSEVLETVGELRPGVPLRLHRAAVRTDLLITVGEVRHHYFAGFGGGPKMVFPGVGGHDEIQANHALVLNRAEDGRSFRHPGCEPGILDGNPIAEEIARASDTRPPDIAICLVAGTDGDPAWAGAGPWREVFARAVELARSWFEVDPGQPCDAMVASGGGAPSDSTLIQAHKGLDAACRFLAPGGNLLYVASIDRGAGSAAMRPFLERPEADAILERLAANWVQYGHTTFRLVEKTARFNVALHSHLDRELATRLGFVPVDNVQDIVDSWRERYPDVTVGVMSSAAVYPKQVTSFTET